MQFAPRSHNTPRILPHDNLPTAVEMVLFQVLLPLDNPGTTGNFLVFGGPGLDRFDYSITSFVVTPEPGTAILLLVGLLLLVHRPPHALGSRTSRSR
jgi:hypothetical protein